MTIHEVICPDPPDTPGAKQTCDTARREAEQQHAVLVMLYPRTPYPGYHGFFLDLNPADLTCSIAGARRVIDYMAVCHRVGWFKGRACMSREGFDADGVVTRYLGTFQEDVYRLLELPDSTWPIPEEARAREMIDETVTGLCKASQAMFQAEHDEMVQSGEVPR